jgi:hypothetical protein
MCTPASTASNNSPGPTGKAAIRKLVEIDNNNPKLNAKGTIFRINKPNLISDIYFL